MTYDIRAFSCKNSFGYSVTIFLLIFMFVVGNYLFILFIHFIIIMFLFFYWHVVR